MFSVDNRQNKIEYENIKDSALLKAINLCEEKVGCSHSPYSNIKVVAAAILENGEIVYATNQENIAFPSGVCAEVNLLGFCGSNRREMKIKTIVVRGFDKKGKELSFISPCGNCRQVLIESETRQKTEIEVVFGSKGKGFYQFKSSKELLPYFFSQDSVELL